MIGQHRPIGIVQLRIREVMRSAHVWHVAAVADVVDRAESQARTAIAALVGRGMASDLGGGWFTATCASGPLVPIRGRCLWPLRRAGWDPPLWGGDADVRCPVTKYQDDDERRLDRCRP